MRSLGALALLALPSLASSLLYGIDVSKYQGVINWPALVAHSNISFVSIRATEGTDYSDPMFAANWKGAHDAGLVRTAYHFARPAAPAAAQADFFVDAVVAAGGYANSSTMQLMLDLEVNDSQSPAVVWAWTQAFSARVLARTGRPLLMYTGYYFWRDSVGNPTDNLNAPLWIAAYIAKPLIPTAWPNWTFWQHDDNGRFVGIDGNVDVDYFNGDRAQLEKLCFP